MNCFVDSQPTDCTCIGHRYQTAGLQSYVRSARFGIAMPWKYRPDCGVRPVHASGWMFGIKGLLAEELQQFQVENKETTKR